MMGYEGRVVLLEDETEWVNIPLVVKEFLKQLNSDVQTSKNVIESLRREQKDINGLLRRVIEKQTNLEIDNTRTMLSVGSHSSRLEKEAEDRRTSDQIHYLRKKCEKLNDRVQLLESSSSKAIESVAEHRKREEQNQLSVQHQLESLQKRAESAEVEKSKVKAALFQELELRSEEVKTMLFSEVTSALQRASQESDAMRLAVAAMDRKVASAMADGVQLRSYIGEVLGSVEEIKKRTSDRFTSICNTVEHLENFCDTHSKVAEKQAKELKQTVQEQLDNARADSAAAFAEVRGLVNEGHRQHSEELEAISGEVAALKRRLLHTETAVQHSDLEATVSQTLSRVDALTTKNASLGESVGRLAETCVSKSDVKGIVEMLARDAMESSAQSASDVKDLRSKLEHAVTSIDRLRKEGIEDSTWLHEEIVRAGAAIKQLAAEKMESDQHLESLQILSQELSSAVEKFESVQNAKQPASTQGGLETHSSSRKMDAVYERFEEQQEATQRLAHQLNTLSSKVDGGANRVQALGFQLEESRRAIHDDVLRSIKSEEAMRELTPALIEVETVKRRLASLEMEVRSTVDPQSNEKTSQVSAATVCQRYLQPIEESMDGFKRRLLDLGQQLTSLDQRLASVGHDVRHVEEASSDTQDLVSRLGSDLTAALESLLTTEKTLTSHQSTTEFRLQEVHEALDRLQASKTQRSETAADSRALPTTTSASTDAHRVEQLALGQERLRTTLESLEAQMTHLRTSVENRLATAQETNRSELRDAMETCQQSVRRLVKDNSAKQLEQENASLSAASSTARTAQEVGRLATSVGALSEEVEGLAQQLSAAQERLRRGQTESQERIASLEARQQSASVEPAGLVLREEVQHLAESVAALEEGVREVRQSHSALQDTVRTIDARHAATAAEEAAHRERGDDRAVRLEASIVAVQEALAAVQSTQQHTSASVEELRGAVHDVDVCVRETAVPAPVEEKDTKEDREALMSDILAKVRELTYPRAELEERLENIWASVIELVARKEDVTTVDGKLKELHSLLQEELKVSVDCVEAEVKNRLKEKASVEDLRRVLAQHVEDEEDDFF